MFLDPSKHVVFIVQITHWAALAELWEHFFSTLFCRPCFFLVFVRLLVIFRGPKGSPNGRLFSPETGPNSTPSPKSAQRTPKWSPRVPKWSQSGPQGCQNDAKVIPEGAKTESQGPRDSGFQNPKTLRKLSLWLVGFKLPAGTVAARRAANWIYVYMRFPMNSLLVSCRAHLINEFSASFVEGPPKQRIL